MPRILIDGAKRAVLFQPTTGNILDMATRQLQSVRVVETEERTETAAGDRRARRRRRELRITSPDQNLVRFARQIRDIGCGCQAIILGAKTHCVFADRVNLDVKQNEQGQMGSVVGSTMQMDSTRFYADVEAGESLLAGVPWAVSEVQIADTLARLNTRSLFFRGGVDCTSIGSGDDNFLAAFGDEAIEEPITGNLLFVAGAGSEFTGVTYDGTDIIAIDNAQDEIEVWSTSATEQSRDDYYTTGDTLGSAAYHQGHGILYVVNEGNARIDVITDALDGTSVSLQRYIPIDVGQNARSIVVDQQEDELLVGMDGGEVEVWTIEGPSTSESFDSIYEQSNEIFHEINGQGWDGLAIHEDALYGLETGASNLDVVSRWQLGVAGQPTWQGRAWRVPRDATVNLNGDITAGISSRYPAVLEMFAPLANAQMQLIAPNDLTGRIRIFSPKDQETSNSGIVTNPTETYDGELTGVDAYENLGYSIRLYVESTARTPELRVLKPGTPLGARRGSSSTDCTVPARNRNILYSPTFQSFTLTVNDKEETRWDYDDSTGGDSSGFESIVFLDSSDGSQVYSSNNAEETHQWSQSITLDVRVLFTPDFASLQDITLNGQPNNQPTSDIDLTGGKGFPVGPNRVYRFRNGVTADWVQLAGATEARCRGATMNGPAADLPKDVEVLRGGWPDGGVLGDDANADDALSSDKMEYFLMDGGLIRLAGASDAVAGRSPLKLCFLFGGSFYSGVSGDPFHELLAANRNLEQFWDRGFDPSGGLPMNLEGQITSTEASRYGVTQGDPLVTSNCTYLRKNPGDTIASTITDFRDAGNLSTFRMAVKRAYDAGKLDKTIDGTNGMTANNGLLSQLDADLREVADAGANFSPIKTLNNTISPTQLDIIAGLGGQTPLINSLSSFSHYAYWTFGVATRVDDSTLEIEVDLSPEYIQVNGGVVQIEVRISGTDQWIDLLDPTGAETTGDANAMTHEIRVAEGATTEGNHIISSTSVDSTVSPAIVTLNIDTGQLDGTLASGIDSASTVHYRRYWAEP